MKKILIVISLIVLLFVQSCSISSLFESKDPYRYLDEEFTPYSFFGGKSTCVITNNTLAERFEIKYDYKKGKNSYTENFIAEMYYVKDDSCLCWTSNTSLESDLNINIEFKNKENVEKKGDVYEITGDTIVYLSYADLDEEIRLAFKNYTGGIDTECKSELRFLGTPIMVR